MKDNFCQCCHCFHLSLELCLQVVRFLYFFFPQLEPLNGITTPSLWLLSLAEHCGSFWLKRKTEN